MAELQKDPITRSDFLGFGVMGAIVGAILTIPPAAFVLGPIGAVVGLIVGLMVRRRPAAGSTDSPTP